MPPQTPSRRPLASLPFRLRLLKSPYTYAALLILGSLALRAPVLAYHGQPLKRPFDDYTFAHIGSYTDIASIWFRDHLIGHPLPYFDYPFEYPVLTGAFVYIVGLVHSSLAAYFLTSAALLGVAALASLSLIRRFPGSKPWLFALAPALVTELIVNWDMLSILCLLAALLLYVRERDAAAGAVLALGVFTKLFPILLLPIVIVDRLRRRRYRELLASLSTFTLVSLAVNLPVALVQRGGQLTIRESWLHFFTFNANRRGGLDLWSIISESGIRLGGANRNAAEAVLLGGWVLLVLLATHRAAGRAPAVRVLPTALLSMLAFFMFANKVYSPQYGLWTIALLAVAGAPVALALPFLLVDLAGYLTSFITFAIPHAQLGWYLASVLRPATEVRLAMLLLLAAWAVRALRRMQATRADRLGDNLLCSGHARGARPAGRHGGWRRAHEQGVRARRSGEWLGE